MNSEHKQSVNLSIFAFSTLQEDMETFAPNRKFNGFINDILERYSESAKASIHTVILQQRNRLREALEQDSDLMSELTPSQQEKIICLLDRETEASLENVKSASRGNFITFRLNKSNFQRFCADRTTASLNKDYYGGYFSRYFKAVIEEYCELSRYEREEVYFRDLIDTINQAIGLERMIRVEIETPFTESAKEVWDVRPYDIMPDTLHLYHYLIGRSVRAGGARRDEKIVSIRLSRIRKITILNKKTYRNGALSANEKKEILQKIQHSSVSFLIGEDQEIIVRFTKTGEKIYKNTLFMRPPLKCIDDKGNYHFLCSQLQALRYFIRFGPNAEILSPQESRQEFAELYRAAADLYN